MTAAAMRFGLPGGRGALAPGALTTLDLAQEAEGQGYDSLWISEEHFSVAAGDGVERRRPSALVLAAALAARTHRIRIGFSVLLLPLHDPLRLAEDIATLDVLSGGRIELGIGWPNERYVEAFGGGGGGGGVDGARLQDRLARLLEHWQRPLTLAGLVHQVEPRPTQRPHPPICVAARDAAAIRWAAAGGHGLIVAALQSAASLRRCLRLFEGEGGTVADSPVERFCVVAQSDAAAYEQARPMVRALMARLAGTGLSHHPNLIQAQIDADAETFCRETALVGAPDTVARRIAELRDELGVRRLNLRPSFWGTGSLQQQRSTAALFAAEVMPRLCVPA